MLTRLDIECKPQLLYSDLYRQNIDPFSESNEKTCLFTGIDSSNYYRGVSYVNL